VSVVPEGWPDPAANAFETWIRVRFHELDALGHVNNANYLNYIEQAAIDHAAFLGLGMAEMRELGGVFVARRHEIDFMRPALGGDTLRLVTWLATPRGARVERSYLIMRDVPVRGRLGEERIVSGADVPRELPLIARARTEWVFVDDGGHPRRVPADVTAQFQAAPRESRAER
jgi:YbgC/YbaW family acyl-CoA thioester hydrolase